LKEYEIILSEVKMYTINQVKNLSNIFYEYLTPYINKYKIEDIYQYNFNIDDKTLFEIEEINKINDLGNGFNKNIILKDLLSKKFKNNESDYPLYMDCYKMGWN